MSNPFTQHPKEVGLNYFTHLIFAFWVIARLIAGVFTCFVHAFFPFMFTTTTSGIIKELHSKIEKRKQYGK
ncbi:MAG: DUF6356 family protein [Bacteroidota bacterium]